MDHATELQTRVKMARWLALDVVSTCAASTRHPDALQRVKAGECAGDFYDANESTVDAYAATFGPCVDTEGEGGFTCPTTPEELARCNAAIRLASLMVVGAKITEAGMLALVAEDDAHGLAQVGGGDLMAALLSDLWRAQ